MARITQQIRFDYYADEVAQGLLRHFDAEVAKIMGRIQNGTGLGDPDIGIQLQLTGKTTGTIDRRRFSQGRVGMGQGVDYVLDKSNLIAFSKLIKDMEFNFSRDVYTYLRKSYKNGGFLVATPLKPRTIINRRYRKIFGVKPYYATGSFYRNGIKHNTRRRIVYFSTAPHPKKSSQSGPTPTYLQIMLMNEYGRPDHNIPARPVLKPVVKWILSEYRKQLLGALQKYIT